MERVAQQMVVKTEMCRTRASGRQNEKFSLVSPPFARRPSKIENCSPIDSARREAKRENKSVIRAVMKDFNSWRPKAESPSHEKVTLARTQSPHTLHMPNFLSVRSG